MTEDKVAMLMALLNDCHMSTTPLTPYNAKVWKISRIAVDELNLVQSGKLEARDADEYIPFIGQR